MGDKIDSVAKQYHVVSVTRDKKLSRIIERIRGEEDELEESVIPSAPKGGEIRSHQSGQDK